MPRSSPYALLWSEEQQHYELHLRGQLSQRFLPGESEAFSRWLSEQTAFAFAGQAGWLSVIKEARAAGAGYWYAYRTQNRHTRKCYLGPDTKVTFARLEEAASRFTLTPVSHEQSRRSASQQQKTFLSIKLAPPRLPNVLVERSRLLRDLDTICTCPLTLVSASAGSGKTTLLTTWISEASQRLICISQTAGVEGGESELAVAWLSLDVMDNDPLRFWGSCIAALQTCVPSIGHEASALLHTPEAPPLSTILAMLLNDVREEHKEFILILDDYHVIEHQTISESMLFFLDHFPSNFHLVFVTRADPELPLARWRARGQLIEIRDRDLRFSREEAASFLLQALGHPLSEEEIALLQRHTEGWIVGLQLAALSLSKRENVSAFVRDFGGSHRFVLDYVQEEILLRLPVALQNFLLQTSILTRMNAAACQAVMAGPDLASSQQLLEDVERANLFLVPLDDERQWYRYHDLFREALLARLHARQPALTPLLHIRAARFYEAAGELREAIAHALAAPDYPLAASLMERTAEQFWVRGEAVTMARWVLTLPEPLVREHARLLLTTALYLLNTVNLTTGEQRARVYQHIQQLMARVETALQLSVADETSLSREDTHAGAVAAFPPTNSEAPAAENVVLQRRLRLLRAGMAWYEALETGEDERLSTLHQEIQALDQDEEVIWQLLPLACSFVLHFAIRQEGAILVSRLQEAKERVRRSGSHLATTRIMQWLAMAHMKAGHLRLAYQESLDALELIEQITGYTLLKGYFELIQAQVLSQWNRLEEARGKLHTVIEDAVAWQHSDLLLSGYLFLMQVELARGDLVALQQTLHNFEHLEAYQGMYHWRWLPAIQAQLWLAQGQVNKASGWAAGIVFPQGAWHSSLYAAFPVVIRVYFAQRCWTKAASLLERWSSHLDRPANIEITITYLCQLLVALHQTGKSEQAREVAVRLLALTEPEGYLRVYLDEGEPLKEALSALREAVDKEPLVASSEAGNARAATSISGSFLSRLLAAFQQEEWRHAHHGGMSLTDQQKSQPELIPTEGQKKRIEPLSRQELRVLRLLVAGQTYAEMAEALVVSPNTIKSQVSSIYRKLDVRGRLQACTVAQQLHLL